MVGLDKLASMILWAKKKIKIEGDLRRIFFVQGDAVRLPFHNDSFDLVMGSLFIFFLDEEETARFIAEVYRVLSPEGLFYFINPNRNRLIWLATRLFARERGVKTIEYSYTPRELRRLFPQSQFLDQDLTIKSKWFGLLTEAFGLLTKPPQNKRAGVQNGPLLFFVLTQCTT